jgi:hypothetical protein
MNLGSGIFTSKSALLILDCEFYNTFSNYGGAIYLSGAFNLTISNNTFIKTKALFYGGSIFLVNCMNIIIT